MEINDSNYIRNYVTTYNVKNNTPTKNSINSTSLNEDKTSEHLVEKSLDNLGNTNSIQVAKSNEVSTPSGVKNYSNYTEYDDKGNEIVKLYYTQEGDSILQHIKTVSPNGVVVEKLIKNTDTTGDNSTHLKIIDKNGNTLLQRDKVYTKVNSDEAQSTVNGEIYNISGLSSDVIHVKHNNETVNIDLNKLLNPDVVVNKDSENPYRKEKITQEEKEKLFDKIKVLHGDDLIRLSKSVQNLQYFAGNDAFFDDRGKTLQLSTIQDWDSNTTVHELGHAYNHKNIVSDTVGTTLSSQNNLKNIRINATKEYLKNKYHSSNDERFYGKFLDTKHCMECGGYVTEDRANENLQDEIFAESYNLLNGSKVFENEGLGCPGRMISMMKYMPEALIEVNKEI